MSEEAIWVIVVAQEEVLIDDWQLGALVVVYVGAVFEGAARAPKLVVLNCLS